MEEERGDPAFDLTVDTPPPNVAAVYQYPPFLNWTYDELVEEADRLKTQMEKVSGLIGHSGNGHSYQREGSAAETRNLERRQSELAVALWAMRPDLWPRPLGNRALVSFPAVC